MRTWAGAAALRLFVVGGVLLLLPTSKAQCACGYEDPSTQALFTDSIITYFNESDAADQVAFRPEKSADRFGRDDAGWAGTGPHIWINSQRTNQWEDDFSATWRSAVSYDHTYLANNSMTMMVSPADRRHRISYGSQFQTRRRDILFGTFRTMVLPPSERREGTEFDIELAYNESSVVQTSFFSNDNASDAAVGMGYSSKANALDLVLVNQTNISPGFSNAIWHEYRMDWLPDQVRWSNDGTNSTLTSLVYTNHTKNRQFPALPAPFSFKHWANGSPTGSKGPPLHQSPLARILYARLFFNSSLPSRTAQFEEQCAAAGRSQICSTDDLTLRYSTPFDITMTEKQLPTRGPRYHTPRYAWIGFTISIGLFTLLFVHALVIRLWKNHHRRKVFYEEYNSQKDKEPYAAPFAPSDKKSSAVTETLRSHTESSITSNEDVANLADRIAFEKAMALWDKPDLILAHEHENDTNSESDLDDKEEEVIEDPFYTQQDSQPDLASSLSSPSKATSGGYRAPSIHMRPSSSRAPSLSNSGSASNLLSIRIQRGITSPTGIVTPTGSGSITPTSSNWALAAQRSLRSSRERGDGQGAYTPPEIEELDSPAMSEYSIRYQHSFVSDEDGFGAPPSLPDPILLHSHPTLLLEDGNVMGLSWTTPVVEWTSVKPNEATQAQGKLAQPKSSTSPIKADPDVTTGDAKQKLWARFKEKFFVRKGEGGATASGASRVEYLDGLRGFACLLVSVHHWTMIFYYGFTTPGVPVHYEFEHWMRRILGPVICNGGLNVGIFFVLAARVIANRFLVRGSLQDLAQQIFTRVPRLATTITAALFINYFLIEVGAFYWVARLPSRTLSVWSYYQNFSSVGEFINDYLALWFMQPPSITPLTRHYATGILWTVPVIIQSSWTVYLCALIAREIKNPYKRYAFYLACFTLEWWSDRYDYFFIGGLMVADLDNRLKYRQLSAKGFRIYGKFRMTYEPFAWLFFFLGAILTWLTQQRVFNARNGENNIKANFTYGEPNVWAGTSRPYYAPSIQDCIWVFSFFLLCDLSNFVRTVFTLRIWSIFGRNAFSLYLLHGTVFWTVGAVCTLKMLAAGIPYWAAMLINFPLCYCLLFFACELFTRTFDRWGIMVARAFWRAASGGLGRRLR